MSLWSYRVIRDDDGFMSLHEVYYGETGDIYGWNDNLATFRSDAEDGVEAIIDGLQKALKDAKHYPVLEKRDLPDWEEGE